MPALRLGFVPRGERSLAKLAAIRQRVGESGARPGGARSLPQAGVTMADVPTVTDAQRKLDAHGDLHGGAGLADKAERHIGHVQDVMGRAHLRSAGRGGDARGGGGTGRDGGGSASTRAISRGAPFGAFQRNRFAGTVDRARIQLDAGYLDEAAASATDALAMLLAVRSALYTGKLADVRKRLEPYHTVGHLADVIHSFDVSPAAATVNLGRWTARPGIGEYYERERGTRRWLGFPVSDEAAMRSSPRRDGSCTERWLQTIRGLDPGV